jgi:hypothetical protein
MTSLLSTATIGRVAAEFFSQIRWFFKVMAATGRDEVCDLIFATRGMPVRIAKACGITRQSVYQWKRVPPHWVSIVAKLMKLPPGKIRPDVFR